MKDMGSTTRRFFTRIARRDRPPAPAAPGTPTVTTGREAVQAVEGWMESVPGALATATGLALGGLRATAYLEGPELDSSIDALAQAAGRNLPLVVHLTARARARAGEPLGSGHEAYHAAADTGAMLLFASTPQEAADLALVARRVAETVLAPVVVAMDVETAEGVEDVRLLHEEATREFLGHARDTVHPGTPAQELLFGQHRERVPAWHDLDRPLLTGPALDPRHAALIEASRHAYLAPHVPEALDAAFVAFAQITGRSYGSLREIETRGAQLLIVAQGSAVEVAAVAAHHLREHGLKVGVIGITALRPFPDAPLAEALIGARGVLVLERTAPVTGAEPPLAREIRGVLDRVRENARFGKDTHPGLPVAGEKTLPRLTTVYGGLGGASLHAGDLVALIRELEVHWRSPVHLGQDVAPAATKYPKRQILHDALRRRYPEAGRLGSARGARLDPFPPPAISLGFYRLEGQGGDPFVFEAGDWFHRLSGGRVRGRHGLSWEGWDTVTTDRLVWSPEAILDPGEDALLDVAVWMPPAASPRVECVERIRPGGALLLPHGKDSPFWSRVPAALRRAVRERGIHVYALPVPAGSPRAWEDRLLGAVAGVLQAEKKIEASPRRMATVYTRVLEDLAAEDREERLAAFQAGADLAMRVEVGADSAPEEPATEPQVPAAVRQLARTEDTVHSLSRFWDHTGVLLSRGEAEGLTPDPFLATAALPAWSASLRDVSRSLTLFPAWDAEKCTGCGVCWSVCPDSSILATAVSPGGILDTGMRLAKEQGRSAESLRMVQTKLVATVGEKAAGAPGAAMDAAPLLGDAFAAATAKTTLPEEKRAALAEAIAAVCAPLAGLRLVRTRPFFEAAEAQAKGSGELLTLALNPDTCKGCGLCVAECEPEALTSGPVETRRLAQSRADWRLLFELPGATPATVDRVGAHPDVGPLPALMLGREATLALSGGDGAEPGSGAKIAVRQVLGVTLHHLQSNINQTVEDIVKLRDKLADSIRGQLAGALPLADLEVLSEGLASLAQSQVDLGELAARFEVKAGTGSVDTVRLRRLVEAAREVADLEWQLTQGPTGLGRARVALLVAPGTAARWAGVFPHNPFLVPVALDGVGETVDMARGLVRSHLEDAVHGARVRRRARLELERPGEAPHAVEELKRLSFAGLEAVEKHRTAPLLLVADEATLAANPIGAWLALLEDEVPIKVLVLSNGFSDPDPAFLPLSSPGVFVVQTSIAHPGHLAAGLRAALDHPGPAWIRIYAPSPQEHGFASDATLARAREAVEARVHLLYRLSPSAAGAGTAFPWQVDLEGNPHPEMEWSVDGEGRPRSPVSWAQGERRFAREFTRVEDPRLETTPVLDFLAAPQAERTGQVPVIAAPGGEGFLRVEAGLLRAAERARLGWRLLRALAALPAAPAAVPEAGPAAVAQLAALAARYEERIAALRAEFQGETTRRVHDRLLALVRRGAGNGKDSRS